MTEPAFLSRIVRHVPVPEDNEPVLPERMMTNVIDAQDRIPERDRLSVPGYTHVSSLLGYCSRMATIMRSQDMPLVRPVTGAHRVLWRFGRAVETHVREQYIQGVRRVGVYGQWVCLCGETVHRGMFPRDGRCERCNQSLSAYKELPLFDEEARIVGNPDLILTSNRWFIPVEIKSMNKRDWDALTEPLADHIFQASWYRYLLRLNGYKTTRRAVFIYTSKDFKWGSPYKEFHIDVATPAHERLIEELRREVMASNAALLDNFFPARTCTSPTNSRAKACPAVGRCFSMSQ